MQDISLLPDYAARPKDAPLALEGVRVVDFTQFISGPYATLMLADFGADVLKIERPGVGDEMRLIKQAQLSNGDGGNYLWANRNKRSLVLDLSTEEGRQVAFELMTEADVVVENFSPGVMQRLNLDYDRLAAVNPKVVYCSISAAGSTGSMSKRSSFDPVTQAESGIVALNNLPGERPRTLTTPIADLSSGMMGAVAILAALAGLPRLGRGQHIEVAMYDQGINMLAYFATDYLLSGEEPVPNSGDPHPAPSGIFATRDKAITICCANDRIFRRLMTIFERDDLADDPRFSTMAARGENGAAFFSTLEEILATDTQENWLRKMRAVGIPAGPVASVTEALTSEDIAERALISRIPHPSAGWVPHVRPPYRLGLTPVADPVAAPGHGEHTEEVLREVLGYESEKLDQLRAAGIFGATRIHTEA